MSKFDRSSAIPFAFDGTGKRKLLKLVAMSVVAELLPGCGGGGTDGAAGTAGPTSTPAAITSQPGDQTVSAPATATFSVTATGDPAPSYQWQVSRDGGSTYVDIAGATGATYTTPATTSTDSGERLRVVVANPAATITSPAATLTVVAAGAGALAIVAGNPYGPGADGAGAGGTFWYPSGPAVDSAGNVYLADSRNQTIRRVTPAGVVSTFAGTLLEQGNNDGTGAAAGFYAPSAVAIDSAGTLYVSDRGNNLIRRITAGGVVTTLAGSGAPGSADGTGAAASFFGPGALCVDTAGNLFVADAGNDTIRRITPTGVVSTFAGSAGLSGTADGVGSAARFANPQAIAIDAAGALYVGDYANHTVRKITPAGLVTTFAGTPGVQGGTNGPAATATFAYPIAVAVDRAGNVYVADGTTTRLRRITPGGTVSTLVDASSAAGPFDFTANGLATDAAGNVVVTSGSNDQLLKVTPDGTVSTLAGSTGANGGRINGIGAAAQFLSPTGVAGDGQGNLVVVDSGNDTLRRIALASATVTNLCGAPPTTDALFFLPGVLSGVGNHPLAGFSSGTGSVDGSGNAASFAYPLGVVADGAGSFWVADANNSTVRRVTAAGAVTTFAGTAGASGTVDGAGAAARFGSPAAIARDPTGAFYVTDYDQHVVRKVSATGVVTTLAGTPGVAGSVDGNGAQAQFRFPTGVAVDAAGNVFVADSGNHTLRQITPAGRVSTLAGAAGAPGSSDGTGAAARLAVPIGLAIDPSGNLYVADSHNHTVRRVTPAGVVTTVVGVAGRGAFLPGALPGGLRDPAGLALVGATLYITSVNGVVAVSGLS